MARVFLVRHGDAVGTTGKFHGLKDNPLTDKGVNEAIDVAKKLGKTGLNFRKIYTSPLSRTRDTAHIISDELGIPVEERKELLPLDLGEYVGKPTEIYKDDVQHYMQHPKEQIPNGGTVDKWAKSYIPFANKHIYDGTDDNDIFVTHGRNIVLTKADMKLGNNPRYDNMVLADNDKSTQHGGYAVADGNSNSFKIVDSKKVAAGTS